MFVGGADGTGWKHLGFTEEAGLMYEPPPETHHQGELDIRAASIYYGADLTTLWPPIERVEVLLGPDGSYRKTVYYRTD